MEPKVIRGNSHSDERGTLFYNNDFDTSAIKRVYVIENKSTNFIRAWQGHKIEQRWLITMHGSFEIKLIAIDNWEKPSVNLQMQVFTQTANQMHVLHIPKGFVSSIQAIEEGSKLLVMSDYFLGEIDDEYRYDQDYFKQ